jgi:hypothetical protein
VSEARDHVNVRGVELAAQFTRLRVSCPARQKDPKIDVLLFQCQDQIRYILSDSSERKANGTTVNQNADALAINRFQAM